VLEITESAPIQDLHSYLRRLEGCAWRWETSAVDRVHDSQRDRLLLQGVLRLVRPLGLAVCAEGVELAEQLAEQLAALSHLGVPAYDACRVTEPLPAEEASE